jgi:hypothetical protein
VEEDLKTAALPPLSWYDLLLELLRAEPGGLRTYRLQSAMLIPQYNMSRLIDSIAKAVMSNGAAVTQTGAARSFASRRTERRFNERCGRSIATFWSASLRRNLPKVTRSASPSSCIR